MGEEVEADGYLTGAVRTSAVRSSPAGSMVKGENVS
jgi:hypothetical protein